MRNPTAPFDDIADAYDEIFTESPIGQAQRHLIWREMDRSFKPGDRILELNCGTGIDAVYLSQKDIAVDACDASPQMVEKARLRLSRISLGAPVTLQCRRIEQIAEVSAARPYDGVLSNFAGLNCVGRLDLVGRDLAALVRPGGLFVACLFGPLCPWEILWYLAAGNPSKALRRFHRAGSLTRLGSAPPLKVYYPTVASVRRSFAPHFTMERWRAVGIAVPPSYAASLARRFPSALRCAFRLDSLFGALPVLRALGDHVVLTFRRRE
jgi:SAM-dependent methyltransferase